MDCNIIARRYACVQQLIEELSKLAAVYALAFVYSQLSVFGKAVRGAFVGVRRYKHVLAVALKLALVVVQNLCRRLAKFGVVCRVAVSIFLSVEVILIAIGALVD